VRYLLDTSVVTRLASDVVASRLRSLDAEGVARTAMTDLEVGFSARTASEWDGLRSALSVFAPVDIEARHFQRALGVQRLLAERGLRGRKVPDLVIAAVAEDRGLTVLHYDVDFQHVAAVTGQAVEWIVARGSID
jgi:hypothetical protein